MDQFFWNVVKKSQSYREKKFVKPAKFLIKNKVTANHLTVISLVSGVLAIYFLFNNWYLLILFTILHILFDAFDGVVARLSKENISGKYFDLGSDSLPVFLIFLKIGWFINDFYAYVVAGLFLLSLMIFFISKMQAPFVPMRTAALIIVILITIPFFQVINFLLISAYLLGGIFCVYSLARQLQWFISKK